MVDESVVRAVQNYLTKCRQQGIDVRFGVIFGSQVKGSAHELSDIDRAVVSPIFDTARRDDTIDLLWHTTAYTDNRIEPIACGEWQWEHDDVSTIIEVARREGVRVEVVARTLASPANSKSR